MLRGLLGQNIGYSYSKRIHEQINHLPYHIFDFDNEKLEKFLLKKNFNAVNVTIPYKETVIPYLDELDDIALKTRAVNTIINKKGYLKGYNTDVAGFKTLLEHYHIVIKDKNCLILGTGATSRSIEYVLNNLDARLIIKLSRNKKEYCHYDNIENDTYQNIDIIINTTPVKDEALIDLKKFTHIEWVVDVNYNPTKTKLINDAKSLHIKWANGLMMLVAQACYSASLMDGKHFKLKNVANIYNQLLLKTNNLVLIGMPGVGKTTLMRELRNKYHIKGFDIDHIFTRATGISPSEYLLANGVDEFRKTESELIKNHLFYPPVVVSCGGGIVERSENYEYLNHNSIIILINRIPSDFTLAKNRPLTKDIISWLEVYERRKEIFDNWADITIDSSNKISTTVNLIDQKLKEK